MKASYLLPLLAVFTLLSACTSSPAEESEWTEEEMMEMMEDHSMEEDTMMESNSEIYQEYSQASYDALIGKKPFALFFHASWCPTCIGMEKDILSSLESFTEGSTILVADYDKETELKKQYGITSQSLVVLINAQGEAVETLAAPSAKTLQEALAKLLQ